MTAASIATVLVVISSPLAGQWLNQRTVGIPRDANGKVNLTAPAPRASDGKPDLSGLWNRISTKYDRNIAADLKPGDIQPWAQALVQKRLEDLAKDYMSVLCVPLGPGYSTDQSMLKIIQTPTLIVMLNDDLTYRQIFMDGRALETSPNPNWMGYSVARWEGDTLVVESAGFNDRTWLDHNGHPHTEALRTTERYRRRDFGHMQLEMTLEDPTVYAKPWTVAINIELAADTEMLENVCLTKSYEHWVGKASDDKKSEVKVAPEILAKYVGTYEEQPKLWRLIPRVAVITLSGGDLFGDLDGRGKQQQFARSETEFSGFSGLAIEFIRDAQGNATDLLMKHVSGNYRFARKK